MNTELALALLEWRGTQGQPPWTEMLETKADGDTDVEEMRLAGVLVNIGDFLRGQEVPSGTSHTECTIDFCGGRVKATVGSTALGGPMHIQAGVEDGTVLCAALAAWEAKRGRASRIEYKVRGDAMMITIPALPENTR